MTQFPDIYTRCIKLNGSIDLERLRRLSREMQEAYETSQQSKGVLKTALQDIFYKADQLDKATGKVRDGMWAAMRAMKAIEEASQIETGGTIELQQLALSNQVTTGRL
jgi:hypothetical protein